MYSGTIETSRLERIYTGRPAAEAILEELERLRARRIFLVCSNTLRRTTDEVVKLNRVLGKNIVGIYDSVRPHVPREDVIAASIAANECSPDVIVSLGGGSVTDATKLIALCLKQKIFTTLAMESYRIVVNEDHSTSIPIFDGPDIPVVSIPTTLSGGEFNALSGCTDRAINVKQLFTHPDMAPRAVILDPVTTLYTPDWIWMSTGVRSLDHCFETVGSLHSNDYWDGMAMNGIRLLSGALIAVKKNSGDLAARQKCQMGSWCSMAAVIAGLPLGISHAAGHALGGSFDVPHGYTSCVMAPFALEYNESVNGERQKLISEAFGEPGVPAHALADRLIRALGMPRSLREVNVEENDLADLADYIYQDIWCGTNPRPIESRDSLIGLLRRAL